MFKQCVLQQVTRVEKTSATCDTADSKSSDASATGFQSDWSSKLLRPSLPSRCVQAVETRLLIKLI